MTENVTTPAGQEAVVSMLGNPEAFKMSVCIQPVSNVCCVCTHTVFSWKTLSTTLFVCTVGSVSHPGYKDNDCFFHTVTTTVCVVSSAKHKNGTFCIELFSYL